MAVELLELAAEGLPGEQNGAGRWLGWLPGLRCGAAAPGSSRSHGGVFAPVSRGGLALLPPPG